MHKLNELLNHSGVKGMHWGVRHEEHRALNPKSEKESGKIKTHLKSLKRERQWKSVLKDIDSLSTKDINHIKKRIDLENELKALSKSKMANKSEKQAYLKRHEMSNDELSRKITRLRAKDKLFESISKASKEQREVGAKIARIGSSIAFKYAIQRKLKLTDVIDTAINPHIKTKQDAWDTGITIADSKATNPKVKSALKLAKNVKFKTKDKK
jgi:hypothetical protein